MSWLLSNGVKAKCEKGLGCGGKERVFHRAEREVRKIKNHLLNVSWVILGELKQNCSIFIFLFHFINVAHVG